MSYTPVEIRHVKLRRAILGYRRGPVDRLLEDVTTSFEDVWRERADHADRVELLEGEPEPVAVPRSGGKKQKIWRCAECQTALYSQYTSPRVRFVRAGTLDDPSSVAPDVHIFTRSKLPWLTLPESVPAFNVYYDTEKLWPEASLARLEALRQSA